MEFEAFEKIPRWSREVYISEKIDGSNASIVVMEECMFSDKETWEEEKDQDGAIIVEAEKYTRVLRPGSRNRYITESTDNYGFWKWCFENKEQLAWLGLGRHFGEWWGLGIQRRYNNPRKEFSLFNPVRWTDDKRPPCCSVVPMLYQGELGDTTIKDTMDRLRESGSQAFPTFMDPEGIIIYHTASKQYYKKTFEGDREGKERAPTAIVA